MKLFLALLTLLLACVPYADLREYHYNRPQPPLPVGLLPQTAARFYAPPAPAFQSSTAQAVIQNFGQTGTAHIAGQLPSYSPPSYQNPSGAGPAYYNAAASNAAAVAASYFPQRAQQHYTPNENPLTHYSQQQQQMRYVNLPQPQQQHRQQSYASGQYGGGAASYSGGNSFNGGQTLPPNGKFVSQSEAGQLDSYQHKQSPIGDTRPFARMITTCQPNGQCQSVTLGPGQPDQRHQHTVAATRAKAVPSTDKCRLIAEANKAQAIANQYGVGGAAGGAYAGGSYGTGPANSQGLTYAGGSYGIGAANSQAQPAQGHLGQGNAAQGPGGQGSAAQGHGSEDHSDPHNAAEPAGLDRPHDRRLFPYSEVALPRDPYN